MRQLFNAKLDTVNYKLRQILQSATRLITNCDGTCTWYTSKFWSTFQTISISSYRPLTSLTSYTRKLIYKITKTVRESIFLRLSWHFKQEKSVFCKASFCKTRTDYACKTSWTRFATGKNFSFNQCHTKSFAFFCWESYFIKAIENFFPVFA